MLVTVETVVYVLVDVTLPEVTTVVAGQVVVYMVVISVTVVS